MYCSKCGKELDDEAIICPNCKHPTKNMTNEINNLIQEQENNKVIIENEYQNLKKLTDNPKNLYELNDTLRKLYKLENYKDTKELIAKLNKLKPKYEEEYVKEKEQKRKRIKQMTIKIIALIVTLILIIVLMDKVIIPEIRYNKSIKLINSKSYAESVIILTDLGNYKDSENLLKEAKYGYSLDLIECADYTSAYNYLSELGDYLDCRVIQDELIKEHPYLKFIDCKIGDITNYGYYNDEQISWKVLDKENDKVLIISENSICERAYNDYYEAVTWEECSLRHWLNNDFYNTAFDENEKLSIKSTILSNDDNSHFSTEGGNDTEDKVFLLSIEEAEEYFADDISRVANYNNEQYWWWLRSPGCKTDNIFYKYKFDEYSGNAACVKPTGEIFYGGSNVNHDNYDLPYWGVRPAMWIQIEY